MRLVIHDNEEEVSKACAEYVCAKIVEAAPTAEKPFVMAVPTGSTARGIYRHLCNMFRAGLVSFKVSLSTSFS